MVDIFTPEKRSWVMSRIRSRDTKIEKRMASLLRKNRLHYRRFPGFSEAQTLWWRKRS